MLNHNADPSWREHARHLLHGPSQTFGGDTATERGIQWGATVISEQWTTRRRWRATRPASGRRRPLVRGDRRRGIARAARLARSTGRPTRAATTGSSPWRTVRGRGGGSAMDTATTSATSSSRWRRCPIGRRGRGPSASLDIHRRRVEYTPSRVAWTTFDAASRDTLRLTFRPTSVFAGAESIPERDAGCRRLHGAGPVLGRVPGARAAQRRRRRGRPGSILPG